MYGRDIMFTFDYSDFKNKTQELKTQLDSTELKKYIDMCIKEAPGRILVGTL